VPRASLLSDNYYKNAANQKSFYGCLLHIFVNIDVLTQYLTPQQDFQCIGLLSHLSINFNWRHIGRLFLLLEWLIY